MKFIGKGEIVNIHRDLVFTERCIWALACRENNFLGGAGTCTRQRRRKIEEGLSSLRYNLDGRHRGPKLLILTTIITQYNVRKWTRQSVSAASRILPPRLRRFCSGCFGAFRPGRATLASVLAPASGSAGSRSAKTGSACSKTDTFSCGAAALVAINESKFRWLISFYRSKRSNMSPSGCKICVSETK